MATTLLGPPPVHAKNEKRQSAYWFVAAVLLFIFILLYTMMPRMTDTLPASPTNFEKIRLPEPKLAP